MQRGRATVALLAGGKVVETGPAAEFFREPRTELGRNYRLYGNCWPEPAADDRSALP